MKLPQHEDGVDRKIELAWLGDFYGGLLTEKQRQVLSLYCEEDLTMSEIAQEAGISRQGVHEMLSRTQARLKELEDSLGMAARFARMQEGLTACRSALTEGRYDEAAQTIDRLIRLDQEDNDGL